MTDYVKSYQDENPPTYPVSPYDNGRQLLSDIGSFWENIFTDSDKLLALFNGYLLEASQAYQKFLETLAAVSRFEVPIFARDNWYYLLISENELTTELLRYGGGGTYGEGYQYGVRAQADRYSIGVPEGLTHAEFVFNRIIDPSLTFVHGVDFTIEDGRVFFVQNPFDNPLVPRRNVVDPATGAVVDREAGLWVYRAEFDLQYVWKHWGYVLGVFMESSTYYRDFLNALADAFVLGPSLKSVEGLLQAMTGIPLVREAQEVVEAVLAGADKTVVATDLNVYTFRPSVTVTAAVGQTVYGGQSLTDSLEVVEIFSNVPAPAVFPALACGPGFLAGPYRGELTFRNAAVPLQYLGVDDDGWAIVRFEVSGFADDVEKFWQNVHEQGRAQGKTFAQYLDTRENPTGQPTPEFLPATINPLAFVLQNFMGNNLCFIRMKVADFAAGAPGVDWFRALRRIMTPHTTCVVYVELSPPDTYIDLADGYESIELLDATAADDVEDELDESAVFEAILLVEVFDCEGS